MDELEKLVAFMNRFPALRKASTSMQSPLDDEAVPADDDLAFITRSGRTAANLGASQTKWPMVDHLLSRTQPLPRMKTPPKPPSPI